MMNVLKDLALALLNATILLLIILTVVVLLLVGRVEALSSGIVNAVVSNLAPHGERLDRIGDQLTQLNTQLETADGVQIDALRSEIAALREQLPDLSGLEKLGSGEFAIQIVNGISQQFSDQSGVGRGNLSN